MQIVEKSGEGLSRVFGVTVPAADLTRRLEQRIAEIAPTLNVKGFRPGKVPVAHVKRLYGRALMGEVVEQTLNETTQKVSAAVASNSMPDALDVGLGLGLLLGRQGVFTTLDDLYKKIGDAQGGWYPGTDKASDTTAANSWNIRPITPGMKKIGMNTARASV